jgi:hypothetical protein
LRLVGLTLPAALALIAFASAPQELEPATTRADDGELPKAWKLADQSCAASNCHGGFEAPKTGRGGHEASVWRSYDPHARAYEVLKSDLARQMMTILARHAGGWAKDAVQEVRCLACHASPVADKPTAAAQFGDDGVSCRSCHGEASKWLATHFDAEAVGLGKDDEPAERLKRYAKVPGLHFLGTPRLRAETCVGCHVGAKEGVDGLPRREVDHDLIAAGHPRLVFDLASQSNRQPRHWRDRPKQNLSEEWAEGQVAAIKALADLAASRAGGPRLDFADQSCQRCHQPLSVGETVSSGEAPSLGKLGWAAPYAPAAGWLSNRERLMQCLTAVERATPTELPDAFTRLSAAASEKTALDKASLPKPDAPVANEGNAIRDRDALLAEYRAQLAADPGSPRIEALKRLLDRREK